MLWSDLERLGNFWDPWDEFEKMRRELLRFAFSPRTEFPAVNMWVNSEHAIVTTEIPGVNPDSIDISISEKTMTLRGSRNPEEIKEGETFHRRERWHGQFTKTIKLPFNVDVDKVNANFSKGVLYIELPRAESEKPKKITVKSE